VRRNVRAQHLYSGPAPRCHRFTGKHWGGVQGTPHKVLRFPQVTPSAAPATGAAAGVYKTAVTTPVCDGLCPPLTFLHSCRRVRGRYRRFVDPGRWSHRGCAVRRNFSEVQHLMRCPLDPARVLTGESVTSRYRSSI